MFNFLKKAKSPVNDSNAPERELYQKLMAPEYKTDDYCWRDLDEEMEAVQTLFVDYWKPRFLVDHKNKCAYEFMDNEATLVGVSDADIDWQTLKGIPKESLYRAKCRNAYFPTKISGFRNGVAEVSWQLCPDGRYWMDDDGFGMSPDEKIEIYGYIDRTGKVVVPYQAITSHKQWDALFKQAQNIVKNRK